ncbi:ABC transporter permease [Nocardia bovistercoris]|uniref:ABC transporter permease n=1 Tax=Nocardia bovistercoris TaxID=2785916 RepID=A0A931I7S5_9NOCA|nr:ABC transporter permease [Nocardia bovistercoris]MBH0775468.1 ABC transporter permease [Nocardia bovistercoris]
MTTISATTVPATFEPPSVSSGFRAAIGYQVRSELIKIRSARSLWLLPTLAVVIGPVAAMIVGLSNSLEKSDTVIGGAFTATTLPLALFGAWGALVVTTEYSSGTIRTVLAATPRRHLVYLAKVLVATVVSTGVGVLSTALTYLVGIAAIDSSKYAAGQPFPGLLGIVAVFPTVALFGIAVGILIRSSAGAVAAVSAHVVLPEAASAAAFGELHKLSTLVAPGAIVAKLSQSADAAPELMGTLGGWPRLAFAAILTLIVLVLARRALLRRDV